MPSPRDLAGTTTHHAALDLARAAAAVVCAPIALARLFPRPGFTVEAFHGLDEAGEEHGLRDAVWAFAELAALKADPLVIEDLTETTVLPPGLDSRSTDLRWCGGVPLFSADGRVAGVVCVFDRSARSEAKGALERLATLVRGFDPENATELPRTPAERAVTRRAERIVAVFEEAGPDLERHLLALRHDCRAALRSSHHPASVRSAIELALGACDQATSVLAALRAVTETRVPALGGAEEGGRAGGEDDLDEEREAA
jgi:hypothetical protein